MKWIGKGVATVGIWLGLVGLFYIFSPFLEKVDKVGKNSGGEALLVVFFFVILLGILATFLVWVLDQGNSKNED